MTTHAIFYLEKQGTCKDLYHSICCSLSINFFFTFSFANCESQLSFVNLLGGISGFGIVCAARVGEEKDSQRQNRFHAHYVKIVDIQRNVTEIYLRCCCCRCVFLRKKRVNKKNIFKWMVAMDRAKASIVIRWRQIIVCKWVWALFEANGSDIETKRVSITWLMRN